MQSFFLTHLPFSYSFPAMRLKLGHKSRGRARAGRRGRRVCAEAQGGTVHLGAKPRSQDFEPRLWAETLSQDLEQDLEQDFEPRLWAETLSQDFEPRLRTRLWTET
jgi:hypothetical protein